MKTAILFYSLSGKTKTAAETLAKETGADLIEITEKRKRNLFTAFFSGCPQAIGLKASKINPPAEDLNTYDQLTLMAPIWAGHPAPALNAIIALLPEGKTISLICTAGSPTDYPLAKTADLITAKNCTITETRCLKTQ